jgi:hypothetical protein
MQNDILHYYRQARAHQRLLASEDRGGLTVDPSGRTERTFGAPYGEHALSAYLSAQRAIYFRRDLAETVKVAKAR